MFILYLLLEEMTHFIKLVSATEGLDQKCLLCCSINQKTESERVGSLSLLQQVFPSQESNQGSCTAGRLFTSWAQESPDKQIT